MFFEENTTRFVWKCRYEWHTLKYANNKVNPDVIKKITVILEDYIFLWSLIKAEFKNVCPYLIEEIIIYYKIKNQKSKSKSRDMYQRCVDRLCTCQENATCGAQSAENFWAHNFRFLLEFCVTFDVCSYLCSFYLIDLQN